LITEIKNAALGAVEAHLLLIFNKRSAQGAICQVVTGRPFKNIDFIVTGRGRPIVPILCIQVWLKIATIQIHNTPSLFQFDLIAAAVLSIKSFIQIVNVSVC
jgi:hypothetical protein